MIYELYDVIGWNEEISCTPTAIAAIMNISPIDVHKAIVAAALHRNVIIPPTFQPDYNPGDWLKAIELLGAKWRLADDFRGNNFANTSTSEEWMARNRPSLPTLVSMCDSGTAGHVFAALNGDVVDTYTRGKRQAFVRMPASWPVFRVRFTVEVLEA